MASRSLPSFILTFLNRILKKHCVQFTPTPLFLSTVRNLLFTKSLSPKFCSICLGDPERVSLEEATGENPFEFCQHVAEYQGQFGQVPPAKDHRNCFFQKKRRVQHSEQSRTSSYCNSRMTPACTTHLGLSLKCFPSIQNIQNMGTTSKVCVCQDIFHKLCIISIKWTAKNPPMGEHNHRKCVKPVLRPHLLSIEHKTSSALGLKIPSEST